MTVRTLVSLLFLFVAQQASAECKLQLTLQPPEQSAISVFLTSHPDLKLADSQDVSALDVLLSTDYQKMRKEMLKLPPCLAHQIREDVNKDGKKDLAILFADKKPIVQPTGQTTRNFQIVVFEASESGFDPVIIHKSNGCLDGFVYIRERNSVEYECIEVSSGSFHWNGQTYIVEDKVPM